LPAGWPRLAAAALAIVAPLRALGGTLARGTAADESAIERYALDLLHSPEPDTPAIVLGTDDHRSFGVLWAQQVLGAAPHVIYIDASLLQQRWYRVRLQRLLPPGLADLAEIDKPVAWLGALWQHEQGRALPVYLANDFSVPSTTLPRVPQGVAWRVLAPWEQGLGPEQVLARHLAARARLLGPPAQLHSPFASDLAASYAEIEGKLARALAAAGRRDLLAQLQAADAAAP
ncbi:MAG: hypothetical protein K1X88_34645, partial [Nannocystaceae bacterium]|nr:hypothetical protein [Nannocystaceae bacterium]